MTMITIKCENCGEVLFDDCTSNSVEAEIPVHECKQHPFEAAWFSMSVVTHGVCSCCRDVGTQLWNASRQQVMDECDKQGYTSACKIIKEGMVE